MAAFSKGMYMLKKHVLTYLFVLGFASVAAAQATNSTISYSFEELCAGKIQPTQNLTLTLDYLKKASGQQDCANLGNWLAQQTQIPMPTNGIYGSCYIGDLRPLAFAKNLKVLNIGYICGRGLSDISPLENLTQLQELNLAGNKVSDISPLKNLKNLQDLDIRTNPVQDLTPLAGLTQLEKLDIRNIKLNDISILFGLKNLQSLTMGNNRPNGPNLDLSDQQKQELKEKIPGITIIDSKNY